MPEPSNLIEKQMGRGEWPGVLIGILLVGALHLLQLLLTLLFVVSFFFIGVTQLVYVIPAILVARRKGRPDIVKGIIIGAAVTFLLNAACYGLLFINSA